MPAPKDKAAGSVAEPSPTAPVVQESQAPPDPQAEATPASELEPWPHWRYTGPAGRVYTALPVTPEPGNVVAWPQAPSTDGCWDQVNEPVTRLPDNHPDVIEAANTAASTATANTDGGESA